MDTDFFFEHESLEWKANIFGTRMDGHGFTMRMVVVLNTNITNIFGHTDRHRWTRIFTMRRITLFILPQMSDEHRFGIFKVALTKTIKTPNCIFRSLRLYIVCRNSLSESKLSSIDLL